MNTWWGSIRKRRIFLSLYHSFMNVLRWMSDPGYHTCLSACYFIEVRETPFEDRFRRRCFAFRGMCVAPIVLHRWTEPQPRGEQMKNNCAMMPVRSHAQTIVSWQFVRWVWHTTFYKDVSHVMFYEDIKASEWIMLPSRSQPHVSSFKLFEVQIISLRTDWANMYSPKY